MDCKIRNLAEDTIGYYEKSFYYFNNYIKEIYEEKEIDISKDITQDLVNNYILYMQEEKGLKITTINIRIRGIRSILYFFMEKGYIDNFKIKQAKADEEIPDLYTDEEIRKLLKKINIKKCSFAEYRTWVVETFLLVLVLEVKH